MSRLIRWPALLLAYLFLVLAIIGIALPGLPTVPFLLLSAWFAARGSTRLHRWLYAHPQLGSLLIDWEEQGAVSRRGKRLALLLLVGSWGVMYWRLDNPWLLAGLAVLFGAVVLFLWSRPEPR
ncbi:MAG: YbaN family protein [Gammaproteobacteria bacterium]|nr:YbaN family protein [Gammaproteobacteria bacterium]